MSDEQTNTEPTNENIGGSSESKEPVSGDEKNIESTDDGLEDSVATNEDDSSDDSTKTETSEESDESYTEDFGEYIGQFKDELPEDIKSIDDLVEMARKIKKGEYDAGSSEEKKKIDLFNSLMKANGYDVTLDTILDGKHKEAFKPSGQQTNEPIFIGLDEAYNDLIKSGQVLEDDTSFRAISNMVDKVVKHNNQKMIAFLNDLYNKYDGLSGNSKDFIDFTRSAQYREYSDKYKTMVLPKHELDTVLQRFPDMGYDQAHAYLTAQNPNKLAELLKRFEKNVEQQISNKKKFKGKFTTIQPKGRTDNSIGNWNNYFTDGKPNSSFYKLSSEKQDMILDRTIKELS